MKILAIDTSCSACSAALMTDGRLTANYYLDNKLTHSVKLMPMVDEILKNLGLAPSDIDVFACGTGPGSFTGLRIGIATVKGLAVPFNTPVAGVCSLEAAAWNFACADKDIYVITDARNKNVFYAAYRPCGDRVEQILPPDMANLEEIVQNISSPCIFAGDGIFKYGDILATNKNIVLAPASLAMPCAAGVALAADKLAKNGGLIDADALLPMYLRKSQAEQELEEKQKTVEERKFKHDCYRMRPRRF